VGRNRVIAVTASLAAILLGCWLVFRWFRDRRRDRRRVLMAHRG
jgi:drug/metabolite transporter superfamily protein YnfA